MSELPSEPGFAAEDQGQEQPGNDKSSSEGYEEVLEVGVHIAPLSAEKLAVIRLRDSAVGGDGWMDLAQQDRRELLGELDRLNGLLGDPRFLEQHRNALLGLW